MFVSVPFVPPLLLLPLPPTLPVVGVSCRLSQQVGHPPPSPVPSPPPPTPPHFFLLRAGMFSLSSSPLSSSSLPPPRFARCPSSPRTRPIVCCRRHRHRLPPPPRGDDERRGGEVRRCSTWNYCPPSRSATAAARAACARPAVVAIAARIAPHPPQARDLPVTEDLHAVAVAVSVPRAADKDAVNDDDGQHRRCHPTDRRRHCHRHHRVVVVDGGGKDTIATTTINRHRRMTTVGSVPPPPPTTTTATLSAIALALTLPWTRIGRRGGGRAATLLFHCRRGCHWRRRLRCLRRRLRLQSQDDGAKKDGRGDRRGLLTFGTIGTGSSATACRSQQVSPVSYLTVSTGALRLSVAHIQGGGDARRV